MAFSGNDELSRLRRDDPTKATEQIRSVILEASGNLLQAARVLKVSPRTLYRWIAENAELRELLPKARGT